MAHVGNKNGLKHGMHGTPTYQAWVDMRRRCEKEAHPAYGLYGARGISVCEAWRDFRAFLADMGVRPDGMSIDRYPNNDGNYEPSNCRWVALSAQQNTRRDCVNLTLKDKTMIIADWSKETGIGETTLLWRIQHGWSHAKTLTTPPRKFNAHC